MGVCALVASVGSGGDSASLEIALGLLIETIQNRDAAASLCYGEMLLSRVFRSR